MGASEFNRDSGLYGEIAGSRIRHCLMYSHHCLPVSWIRDKKGVPNGDVNKHVANGNKTQPPPLTKGQSIALDVAKNLIKKYGL